MATWIAHLRLAENLLGLIDGLDVPMFAIGNVAPDSGIPDEKWEKFDPPTIVTHFQNSDGNNSGCSDLDFFRRYLASSCLEDDPQKHSFRLGYFFHLITDNLWWTMIGSPTKERFPEQFAADQNFIWKVKDDWYGLDFTYVREHPDCLFWNIFLGCEYTHAYLDFLPTEAIQRNIEYIKTYYQRKDEEIEAILRRPFIYLSQADMDQFVEDSTRRLHQVYHVLWIEGVDTSVLTSALALPG